MPVLQGVLDEAHDHATALPAVLAEAAMTTYKVIVTRSDTNRGRVRARGELSISAAPNPLLAGLVALLSVAAWTVLLTLVVG